MKNYFFLITIFVLLSTNIFAQNKTIHSFKVKDIKGKEFDLSTLKGKKVMIVNTASKCAYTPQYQVLERIYRKYKDKNFTIIAFPSNDFLNQEPKKNKDILKFVKYEFGVTFPMMGKIYVKGDEVHPLYQWLTQKSENGVLDCKIRWNFQKFLIDEKGKLVKKINPSTSPDEDEIINWIEGKKF